MDRKRKHESERKQQQILITDPFSLLPDDVIGEIVGFLDSPPDMRNFGMTCTRMLYWLNNEIKWREKFHQKFPAFFDIVSVELVRYHRQQQENSLTSSYGHHATITDTDEIALRRSMLQSLHQLIAVVAPSLLARTQPSYACLTPADWKPPSAFFNFKNFSWKMLYIETIWGKQTFPVQVYQIKSGLDRSFFDGVARYQPLQRWFEVDLYGQPETMIVTDSRRLRAPPMAVRYQSPCLVYDPEEPILPKLSLKEEIEIQWKGSSCGAFAWWYGVVNNINNDGTVEIVFPHFSELSSWYRLILTTNSKILQKNHCGGWLGAIRKLSQEEKKHNLTLQRAYDPPHKVNTNKPITYPPFA